MARSVKSIRKKRRVLQNVAIDSQQLLGSCLDIKEIMTNLEKRIKLAQLRLTTLSYVGDIAQDSSLKCFNDLIDSCNLSQLLVNRLDELQLKLSDSTEQSISYQIAAQQLVFFTSEWYDNLAPKFRQTFDIALQLTGDGGPLDGHFMGEMSTQVLKRSGGGYQRQPEDSRVRDALLRLRQSMGENERLIATIANNIEYTRSTVEAIYNSLQVTKFGLETGEQNAVEAVQMIRQSKRWKFGIVLLLLFVLIVVILFVVRLLGIL